MTEATPLGQIQKAFYDGGFIRNVVSIGDNVCHLVITNTGDDSACGAFILGRHADASPDHPVTCASCQAILTDIDFWSCHCAVCGRVGQIGLRFSDKIDGTAETGETMDVCNLCSPDYRPTRDWYEISIWANNVLGD